MKLIIELEDSESNIEAINGFLKEMKDTYTIVSVDAEDPIDGLEGATAGMTLKNATIKIQVDSEFT